MFPNRGRGSGDPAKDLEENLTKAIDDVAETLRWCKAHLHDRGFILGTTQTRLSAAATRLCR